MKTVLVTGGAGYIGSHACKALALSGLEPIAYDNLIYGHPWAVKWGPLEVGDIADRDRLDDIFKKYQPDAVMHFAAYAYVGESVENPEKYYLNNVSGTLSLLSMMRRYNVNKFVFSSSCATYGMPQGLVISEEHPQKPVNPYGMSKLMVENILKDFYNAYDMRSISLRYFNAAGADPAGEIGEDHDPEPHLIPLVLNTALGKLPEINVFGDDYDTPDGTCIRDYIHVSDLADAHVHALHVIASKKVIDFINLGNGQGFSVKQVIDIAKQVTGKSIPVKIAPRRPGDPPRLVAASGKASQALGWQPKHHELDEIIRTAWTWTNRDARVSKELPNNNLSYS